MQQRILNILIAIDQLLWVLCTFGHASPDETISAGCYRMEMQGKVQGKLFRPLIDYFFSPLQKEHCKKSYESEVLRTQARYI
jgi:hypothetical protein